MTAPTQNAIGELAEWASHVELLKRFFDARSDGKRKRRFQGSREDKRIAGVEIAGDYRAAAANGFGDAWRGHEFSIAHDRDIASDIGGGNSFERFLTFVVKLEQNLRRLCKRIVLDRRALDVRPGKRRQYIYEIRHTDRFRNAASERERLIAGRGFLLEDQALALGMNGADFECAATCKDICQSRDFFGISDRHGEAKLIRSDRLDERLCAELVGSSQENLFKDYACICAGVRIVGDEYGDAVVWRFGKCVGSMTTGRKETSCQRQRKEPNECSRRDHTKSKA